MFRTNVTTIVVVSVLVGVMLGLILFEQIYTYDASAIKKSDKQKLREENQRLQDQIDAMKQIKSQNVILPNGSSVAFSQLPPDIQRAMLNNSTLLNANIPNNDTPQKQPVNFTKVGEQLKALFHNTTKPMQNNIDTSSSHHTKHHSNSNDNPFAKVGKKLKRMFS